MASENRLHIVLVPLLAQGHIIPATDMARLLAERGAFVSVITTPVNAARIRSVIGRINAAGLPIRFVELAFPSAEAGLPEGVENVDLVPSRELYRPFFHAMGLLAEPLERYLREVQPAPSCMVADYSCFYTAEVARKLDLPRVIFHGPSCLFVLCSKIIGEQKVYEGKEEDEEVELPCLPLRVVTTPAQTPGWFGVPEWEVIRKKAVEAEASAEGVLVNTFDEAEPEIIDYYKKAFGKPVWTIGPLSLCNKDVDSKTSRGNKSSVDEGQLLSWLDAKEPKSVVYVSFGSFVRLKPAQVVALGRGLEAANRPFIWVVKETEKSPEVEKWMSEEGFEERIQGRGMVIVGWAPQAVILSHPAMGAFVTHCGWNSILEAISAGVPMITWPGFADQFINEKLVVDMLRVGVSVGIKTPFFSGKDDEAAVKGEEVEKAIARVFGGGDELRRRAAELAAEARRAMEEGGSSYENLDLFMQFIMQHSEK